MGTSVINIAIKIEIFPLSQIVYSHPISVNSYPSSETTILIAIA